jgi:hypothetical protein
VKHEKKTHIICNPPKENQPQIKLESNIKIRWNKKLNSVGLWWRERKNNIIVIINSEDRRLERWKE